MLRKNPGLTTAVIATLMLGIGATTAIYTVVYAVLLAPLPYPSPEQLVMVWSKVNGHNNGMSAGDFLDWKEQSKSFQQLAAWTGGSFNLSTQDQPEQFEGMRSTPGWFSMQGMPFLSGRDFLPEEGIPGRDHAVILTYKLWNRLGANRSLVGKQMRVNGETPEALGDVIRTYANLGNLTDFHWSPTSKACAPPAANCTVPTGVGSEAARSRRTRALPADQGPRKVPKTPRAATVARSGSVSKNSDTKSAAAIGPQRSTRYISFFPRLRIDRPVFSIPHRSLLLGLSMFGGVSVSAWPITLQEHIGIFQ